MPVHYTPVALVFNAIPPKKIAIFVRVAQEGKIEVY
jgi:hypothetical protein